MVFHKFDMFSTLSESWEIFKKYLAMVIVGWILAMAANMALSMGVWMIHTVVDVLIALCLGAPAAAVFDGAKNQAGGAAVGIGLMVCKLMSQIFFQIVQMVLSMFITAGLLTYFIKFARAGTPPNLKTMLVYDKRVLNMVLYQLLLGLIILTVIGISLAPGGITLALALAKKASFVPSIVLGSIGVIVLLVAVIYIQLVTAQAFYLIVEKKIGPIDAFTVSYEAMKGNKMSLLLLGLLMSAAGLVVALCTCFIGLIFFTPFSLLLMSKVYANIVEEDYVPDLIETTDSPDDYQNYDRQEDFYR